MNLKLVSMYKYSTENSMTIGRHLRSSQLICPCRLQCQLGFVWIAVSASWTQVGGASWCNQCLARM